MSIKDKLIRKALSELIIDDNTRIKRTITSELIEKVKPSEFIEHIKNRVLSEK